jgi:hypothetical protein
VNEQQLGLGAVILIKKPAELDLEAWILHDIGERVHHLSASLVAQVLEAIISREIPCRRIERFVSVRAKINPLRRPWH